MENFIIGIITLCIGGISTLAWKKPNAFKDLLKLLAVPLIIIFVYQFSFIYGKISVSIPNLQKELQQNPNQTLQDAKYLIESLLNDFQSLKNFLLLLTGIIIYLLIMLYLPKILNNKEK